MSTAASMICLLAAAGLWLWLGAGSRRAADVLRDLAQDFDSREAPQEKTGEKNTPAAPSPDSALQQLLESQSCNYWQRGEVRRTFIACIALAAAAGKAAFGASSGFAELFPAALFGAALGYIIVRVQSAAAEKRYRRSLEFYLPIVMERVVMAVQAGLDIVAALKRVVQLEKESANLLSAKKPRALDPVTQLLDIACNLCESGLGFEESLRHIAAHNPSFAVRHALIHLALAYKEGGGLVMPLSELSDSTQLYYQESIEEEIARMPVKATMPLVLTFAGLIICFITAPLMQVLHIINEAMPN